MPANGKTPGDSSRSTKTPNYRYHGTYTTHGGTQPHQKIYNNYKPRETNTYIAETILKLGSMQQK